MMFEVAGILWHAMPAQIIGAGAEDHAMARQLAGDEAGVRQPADADREVEAFIDHVDIAIVQRQIELDLWIASKEIAYRRRDMEHSEAHGRADSQAATWCNL